MQQLLSKPLGLILVLILINQGYRWLQSGSDIATAPVVVSRQEGQMPISGNQRIANFQEAKKRARTIYRGMERTFYCGCTYNESLVDHRSCGYKPEHEVARAYRLEWEHVVPAAAFGGNLVAWQQGDPHCRQKNGRRFQGRRCARQVSAHFRHMEADLYNLVPEIGEMNQSRGTLGFQKHLMGGGLQRGSCATLIGMDGVLPREEIRGFIARTYHYMHAAYPGLELINEKNAELLREWAEKYPVSAEEEERGRRIAKVQGNRNPYLDN